MEWYDLKTDIKKYTELAEEDTVRILKDGIQTEFWKLLRAKMAAGQSQADLILKRGKTEGFDDLVRDTKFKIIFKTLEELMNFPDNFIIASQNKNVKIAGKNK